MPNTHREYYMKRYTQERGSQSTDIVGKITINERIPRRFGYLLRMGDDTLPRQALYLDLDIAKLKPPREN